LDDPPAHFIYVVLQSISVHGGVGRGNDCCTVTDDLTAPAAAAPGSLAKFAAMRRASSLVSGLVAERYFDDEPQRHGDAVWFLTLHRSSSSDRIIRPEPHRRDHPGQLFPGVSRQGRSLTVLSKLLVFGATAR